VKGRCSAGSLKIRPQRHKDTVKALVQDHAKSSAQNSAATSKVGAAMDLVRGKGLSYFLVVIARPDTSFREGSDHSSTW
jgi:hypothetical protein